VAKRTIDRHRHRLGVYRREADGFLIEIKLREARQLFNRLDPSPFHEKDLDPAAEEYLVGAVRELGARRAKLIIHLPEAEAKQHGSTLPLAIRNYFTYRVKHTREQLRLILARGFISLAIGLVFLFACLSLRQLLAVAASSGAGTLAEGLLILGWVAMWRPVEIFLYDWWPELGKRWLFARIAGMTVEIREIRATEREESGDLAAARRRSQCQRAS
jgi:hypothetical protein